MFVYPSEIGLGRRKRQSFSDFQNVTVDPIFVDELNFTDEQRELCNNDTQCLVDLVVTNDVNIALMTLTVNENVTMAEELLCEDFSLTSYCICNGINTLCVSKCSNSFLQQTFHLTSLDRGILNSFSDRRQFIISLYLMKETLSH